MRKRIRGYNRPIKLATMAISNANSVTPPHREPSESVVSLSQGKDIDTSRFIRRKTITVHP
jgi:hypothetical protein